MGDDDQPAGVGRPAPLEMAREPGDRLDVQVVGRLVEQQDIPCPVSSAASSTRRRWPPLSVPTGASQGTSASRPRITSRARASQAHTCSGVSPTTARSTVSVSSRASAWPSTPTVTPPRTVTRPELGCSRPAEHGEQAGLAVPVPAHDPNPVALVQPQRHGIEDDLRRELKMKGLGPKKMRHIDFKARPFHGQAGSAAPAGASPYWSAASKGTSRVRSRSASTGRWSARGRPAAPARAQAGR